MQPEEKLENFVWLKDGLIIPLQDTSDGIVNSEGLKDLYIDIHVIMSLQTYDEEEGKLVAEGIMFMDAADSTKPEEYCFTYLNYYNSEL
mmetsp:Transcript_3309/g.2268  ORF Transcript_3309/g.2268 Transcript_3309/m.2268 type:complete len:89 (-) Transcript_3309:341-607(-)